MEWNAETVLDALNEFERKPEISPVLNEYLKRIAKNGDIVFPWCKLKPVLRKKLDVVLDEFYESCPGENAVPVPNFENFNFEILKKTILNAFDNFNSAPFTIQRICELVCNPQEHYNRADKYMRGIEKNILVVSTVPHMNASIGDGNSNPIVNGIVSDSPRDENCDTINGHGSGDSVSSTNLNTPSNHVLLENFANVFPSAACIPSPSNICLNRELENNVIGSSEYVEMMDVKFDSTSTPVEPSTTLPDEEMDTREDDQINVSSDSSEVSSGESESPEHSDSSEQSDKAPETTTVTPSVPEPSSAEAPIEATPLEVDPAVESPKNEAESTAPEPEIDNEIETENASVVSQESVEDCQQDGTVSQSDDEPQTAPTLSLSPPPQENEVPDVKEETPTNHDEQPQPSEPVPEIPSQSVDVELELVSPELEPNVKLETATPSSSEVSEEAPV